MLKALIKKQLRELFQQIFIDRKTGNARSKKSKTSTLLLWGFLFVFLGFSFYSMAKELGAATLNNGNNWIFLSLEALMAIALGVFGSVFNTYASLYLAKDNEFLMSLPIPSHIILLARALGVYLVSLMYSAWIWIPAMIAYWGIVPVTAMNVILPILLTFVIALLVAVLSCLLGWVVAIIASRAKGKSFVTVALSLLALALFYVVYFKLLNSFNQIVTNVVGIGSSVKKWLYYIYLIGSAADGNIVSFVIAFAITAALAAICLLILSKSFLKIAFTETANKKSEKAESFSTNTAEKALFARELKHYTSVPAWMLNSGLGIIILLILAVLVVIKRSVILQYLDFLSQGIPELAAALPIFLFSAVGLIVSLNSISASTISLEGRNLWIMQTLPVEPWEVLKAKIKLHTVLNSVPAIIAVAGAGFALNMEIYYIVLAACAVFLYINLTADLGIILNLRHPNLEWTNIMIPIKQSFPVFVTLFGGWIITMVIAAAGFFACKVCDPMVPLIALIIIFRLVWGYTHRWIKTKGAEIFSTL
ncbi:MAG: putative ABC transporter permease subunit [Lachnospiraceae bacterium]|jgi:ABC-2 type transport system permease protein